MIECIELIWEGVGGETSGVCWTFATVVVAIVAFIEGPHRGSPLFYFLYFESSSSFLLVKNTIGRRV